MTLKEKFNKTFEIVGKKLGIEQKYFVRGSGFVAIPKDRLNEVPKVVKEYHDLEYERKKNSRFVQRAF